ASLRHDQGPDGSDTLPDEDPAAGGHRDGIARAGLQSHARHEHHRNPTADRGNEGVVAVAEPPKEGCSSPLQRHGRPKEPRNPENARGSTPHRNCDTSILRPYRFYTAKTLNGPRVCSATRSSSQRTR